MQILPVLPVAIPLLGAALLATLTKLISYRTSTAIALSSALLAAGASVLLLVRALDRTIVYWFGNWRPAHGVTIGISFVIDPIGAALASFAALLTVAALVFSAKYFDNAANHFHALILAFLGAMCGFTLTGDMFNLFVFFELMSAAAFALCAHKTEDPGSLQGSLNFAVTNTIGAYFVLSGIALLYARTGALNMAQMGRNLSQGGADKLVLVALTFITCGYLIKAAVVPFHFWLADAHAVAPTPICILFSGVMVELGLYAVIRIYWTVFDPVLHAHLAELRVMFVSVGCATAFVGAVMCYSQRSLKRLLAFSTISHMGVMTMGAGLFTVAGLAGTTLYIFGHGLVKASLFMVAGILLHRFASVDEMELHGRGKAEKMAGVLFFLAAIGLAGTPPSGVSVGDDLIHGSAKSIGYEWTRWFPLFAALVTSAAVFRAGGRVFLGWGRAEEKEPGGAPKEEKETQETQSGHQGTPWSMLAPTAVLALGGFFLGFVHWLKPFAMHAAARFEDSAGYAALVLNGLPMQVTSPDTPKPSIPLMGVIALAGALVAAYAHLSSKRFRELSQAITKPLQVLHKLHSGHVGDYVTFVVFGIAAFGFVCLFFVR